MRGNIFELALAPNVLSGERLQEIQNKFDSGVYEDFEHVKDIDDLLAGVAQWRQQTIALHLAAEELRQKLARNQEENTRLRKAKQGAERSLTEARQQIKALGG